MNHAQLFQAMADPVRLDILSLLRKHPGTLTVENLLERLSERGITIGQPTLSYHLKQLYRSGLITFERVGLHHHYYICPDAREQLAALVSCYLAQEEGAA